MNLVVLERRVMPITGFTFLWKIENFSFILKLPKSTEILSPIVTAENLENTSWFLKLYLVSEDNQDSFVFKLCKDSDTGPNVMLLDYDFFILSRSNSKVKYITERLFRFHQGNSYGTPLRITSSEIYSKREILPEDTLTVVCKMWQHRIQCLEPGFCLARTLIDAERKHLTWTIDKFSTLDVDDDRCIRLIFSNQKIHLNIKLDLKTTYCNSGQDVKIQIEGRNKFENCILLFEISVQDINGKSVHHFQGEFTLRKETEEWPIPLNLRRDNLLENKDLLLPDDKLFLKCELTVFNVVSNRIELSEFGKRGSTSDFEADLTNTTGSFHLGKRKRHSSSTSLTHHLKYLFEEKLHADVNIQVRNETFPVHKAILIARSSVFKTMFDTDMKEKLTNSIEINDFEPDTVRRLLEYMYSDNFDSGIEWKNACNLYLAAEKYAVLGLKENCSSYLMINLNVTNVCETLVLAETLSDENLKNFILRFIEDKGKEVLNSNEWKEFTHTHQQLAIALLTCLYKNVKQF